MNRPDCSHPVDKQLIIFILILFFSPSPQARSRFYLWALRRLRFVPHYFQVRVSSCTFQHFIFDVSAPRMINQWHSILTTYSHTYTHTHRERQCIATVSWHCLDRCALYLKENRINHNFIPKLYIVNQHNETHIVPESQVIY